jgi:3-phosphoshikimate 1-carboxyvinyltransferase
VASAQVKSCLVLAGLQAEGVTEIREPQPSRDHTERMLRAFGAPLHVAADGAVVVERLIRPLALPARLRIPGDPSSAAFFVGCAVLVPGGSVACAGVDVNATRTGFLRVLARMGADVRIEAERDEAGDPVATLHVRPGRRLLATTILPAEVPSLLDEVPLLAVVGSQAEGVTRLSGAAELRVKESDRLRQVCQGLRAMGVEIEETDDGFALQGPARLKGAHLDASGDHRIAMAFAVAGLVADGETVIDGAEWADISYPGFFAELAAKSSGAVQQ